MINALQTMVSTTEPLYSLYGTRLVVTLCMCLAVTVTLRRTLRPFMALLNKLVIDFGHFSTRLHTERNEAIGFEEEKNGWMNRIDQMVLKLEQLPSAVSSLRQDISTMSAELRDVQEQTKLLRRDLDAVQSSVRSQAKQPASNEPPALVAKGAEPS